MDLNEYASYDAVGLAKLVRQGDVSAPELQQLAREAIATVNPTLNAVATGPFDPALDYDADGPFAGVPFGLKDILLHAAGIPSRSGTRLAGEGVTLDYDSHLMTRFRGAGLATVAVTTTPEWGFNGNSEALVYGSTRNPWDTERSAGGSSGGSSALVAARALPIAHASDGGGSIRIPAAYNGLVGLKASRGRVPVGPNYSEVLIGGLCTELAVSRTVRDTAAILDATNGWMPGERQRIQEPRRPYASELTAAGSRLRIAVDTSSWSPGPVDPDVAAVVEATARQLEELGHEIVPDTRPAVDWEEFMDANVTMWSSDHAASVPGLAAMTGLEIGPDTLEHTTLASLEHGRALPATKVHEAVAVYNKLSREVGDFMSTYDVLLTPTANTPAPMLGVQDSNDPSLDVSTWLRKVFGICSFTTLFNVTGTPAISLPTGVSESGLPIGVQLATQMGEESTLIQLSAQLEQAMPWAERAPTVCVGTRAAAA